MFSLQQTTPPTVEPITTAEAKAQMRVTISDDDAYIATLIKAARARIENLTGRYFVTQSWLMVMDSFPGQNPGPFPYDHWPQYQIPPFFSHPVVPILKDPRSIIIPIAPVTAVSSVKTVDADGNETTLSSSIYVTDFISEPARIRLKTDSDWPVPSGGLAALNGVRVAFSVGYALTGTPATTCSAPDDLKAAVKLLVAHWYENREDATTLSLSKIPNGVDALIAPYKLWQRET